MKHLFLAALFLFGLSANSETLLEIEKLPAHPSMPGFIYKPRGTTQKLPAIFLLHGSEGWGDYWQKPGEAPLPVGEEYRVPKLAQDLARRGYVVFAYSYFDYREPGYEHLEVPGELAFIDLERTYRAIQWFGRHFAKQDCLTLWGYSRGAEQALLLATLIPNNRYTHPEERVIPNFVVAMSPSDMVRRGISDSLSAVVFGAANKKKRFDGLPAWRWGNAAPGHPKYLDFTFAQGYQFDFQKFTNPILITHYQNDVSWGAQGDLSPLKARIAESQLLSLELSANEHAQSNAERAIREIGLHKEKDRIFVGFPGAGHGWDMDAYNYRYTYQIDLILKAIKSRQSCEQRL